ncbi:MAG TPA: Lsr2 family protein [Acidothermaceae bacterium]|nr:Lsr2 family protein [Acidothermaceae bacterium]
MASKTQVTLVDDLDSSTAAETLGFSLDGKHYQIDLSARNAGALRKVVGPYAEAARRLTTPRRGSGRPYRQVHTEVDPAAIRAWAIANDYEISTRGRVSAAIIEEYRAAATQTWAANTHTLPSKTVTPSSAKHEYAARIQSPRCDERWNPPGDRRSHFTVGAILQSRGTLSVVLGVPRSDDPVEAAAVDSLAGTAS